MMARRVNMCTLWTLIVVWSVFGRFTHGIRSESSELGADVFNEDLILEFEPSSIEGLVVSKVASVRVGVNSSLAGGENVNNTLRMLRGALQIQIEAEDDNIVSVLDNSTVYLSDTEDANCSWCAVFSLKGLFLGRTSLKFQVRVAEGRGQNASEGGWREVKSGYKVSVVRPDRIVDKVFIGLVMVMVMLANVGMGCKVQLEVVKEVLRRPLPPIVGFCCQYLIMPLMSFGLVRLLGLAGGLGLGLFATGCSPAGGSSNMYTFLLGGDVSLSVTMTLISVLASLGMMPLWLFSLGRFLVDQRVRIPFQNIFATLASILIPVALGLLIQHKRPDWAKRLSRYLRPCFIGLLLIVFTFGVWTNLYIFKLISPRLILAACLLPYVSFGLAALVAFICRQPRNRIITIAIETAIQNTGIPILIMKLSLPQPEADLSAVSPVAVACFMPLPLWIAIAYLEIRKRCCKKNKEAFPQADEEQEADIHRLQQDGAEPKTPTKHSDGKMFPLDDTIEATECKNGLLAQQDHTV